jgi:AcrR family transcriptional regulator
VSPRPSIADERRPQITVAAARVIAARGFDRMRLSDVAEAAGVSIGTVQHYFGSREAVLVAAFRHVHADALRRWYAAAESTADPWQRLVAIVDSAIDARYRERWAVWLDYWTLSQRDASMRRDSADLHRAWRAPVVQAIDDGSASGEFRPLGPAVDVADRLIALMDGLALQLLLDVPNTTPERTRDLLLGALARDLDVDHHPPRARSRRRQATAASSARATVSPSSGTV